MRDSRRVDSQAPSASLSMRCASSKKNFTSTSSGLNISREKMRKKHRNLTKLTMEAEKGGVHRESSSLKAKAFTKLTMEAEKGGVHRESSSLKAKAVNGHGYMARFKRMREEKMLQGELAPRKSQKLNQGIEERAHLPLKKRRLRKKYLQCSPDTNESSRDVLLDEEDFCKETSNVDEGRSTMQSVNLKNVKSTTEELALEKSKKLISYQGIQGDVHSASKKKRRLKKKYLQCPPDRSTDEEHCADPISLQQKPSFENKSAWNNNVGDMVNKIHQKIDKKMKKLLKKQKDQIQEFHRVWDDKTSEVDKDHKMEAAIIRTIYGKGSETMDKLIILDSKFAKKVAEKNAQKDMQLKDLELEQLAARNKESEKVASWLAKAKGCISDERTSCCKASLLSSQNKEVSGCSKSRIDILYANDEVAFQEQHGENNMLSRNVCGEHVVQSNNSDGAAAMEVGCTAPNGYPSNLLIAEQLSTTLRDGDASVLKDQVTLQMEVADTERVETAASVAVPELVNTAEALQIEVADLERVESASSVSVSEVDNTAEALQMEVVDLERVEPASSVSVSEVVNTAQALQKEVEGLEKVKIAASDIVNTAQALQMEVAELERVETAASDVSKLVNTTEALQSNDDLQEQVETAIESQSMPRTEVASSENINKTTPVQSSTELQDEDALIDNHEISLEIEVSKSGLAEIATPVQSHIDALEIENREQLQLMPIDASLCNQLASIELESERHSLVRNSSGAAEIRIPLQESTSQAMEYVEVRQSNTGPEIQSSHEASVQMAASFQLSTEAMLSTTDFLHHDVLQLGGGDLLPSGEVVRNYSSLFFDPLQSELERSNKETEELQKSRENMMTGLRSEYIKEIREVVADIQNKYKLKFQDALAQFSLKKNELIQNHNKILKNKFLADSFRNKHFNFLPTRPFMQQDSPSSSMQHQQHFPPAVAATAPNLHTPILNGQSTQEISAPHSTRVAPIASQIYAAPSVQAAEHATAISSGTARPLMQQDSPSGSMQHRQHFITPAVAPTASTLQTPILNGQVVQQISVPHSTRVAPTASQIYAAPPTQAAQHATAISSGTARPPPVMNTIHPTSIPRLVGGMHSSSSNFQASNSAAAPSMPPPAWFQFLRNLQQQQPPTIQNPQHLGHPHASLSPFGLQHHPLLPGNRTSSIPQTNSSFGFFQQPYLDTLSNTHNAHSNYSSCAPPANAICLSDDD